MGWLGSAGPPVQVQVDGAECGAVRFRLIWVPSPISAQRAARSTEHRRRPTWSARLLGICWSAAGWASRDRDGHADRDRRGNARPGERAVRANATAVMAMATMAAIATSMCLPRRAVRAVTGLLSSFSPAGGPAAGGTMPAAAVCGGRQLDVAIAVARAAIVVGVLVTAVALRDGIGGLGRCGGRRRGWCSGRGVRRRQMMVTVRRSRWLRRGVLCCHGGAAARGQRREQCEPGRRSDEGERQSLSFRLAITDRSQHQARRQARVPGRAGQRRQVKSAAKRHGESWNQVTWVVQWCSLGHEWLMSARSAGLTSGVTGSAAGGLPGCATAWGGKTPAGACGNERRGGASG